MILTFGSMQIDVCPVEFIDIVRDLLTLRQQLSIIADHPILMKVMRIDFERTLTKRYQARRLYMDHTILILQRSFHQQKLASRDC